MNNLSAIASVIIGILFFYLRISWLGLIFIIIAIIIFIYDPAKKYAKGGWEEMKKADGGVPDKKIEGYTKAAGKQIVDVFGKDHKTKTVAARKEPGKKIIKGSENFFKEISELFK